MTIEQIAAELRPLAMRLSVVPDENLTRPAMLAKSLICFVMALCEQFEGAERDAIANQIIMSLAPFVLHTDRIGRES